MLESNTFLKIRLIESLVESKENLWEEDAESRKLKKSLKKKRETDKRLKKPEDLNMTEKKEKEEHDLGLQEIKPPATENNNENEKIEKNNYSK